jgi:hypothetical protein
MGSSAPISLTKEKFAELWNGWWPKEADKLNRITGWSPLGEAAGSQSFGEFLPVSGQEDMFYVIQAPSGQIRGIGLIVDEAATVTNPIGPSPLSAGLFMTVFAKTMDSSGEGDLNRLGFFAPLDSYGHLASVNACLDFGKGLHWRLVEVPRSGSKGPYLYLYLRSTQQTGSVPTPAGSGTLRTVTGVLELDDTGASGRIKVTGTTCQGQNAYSDVGPDTPVTVSDESGAILSRTTLGKGTGDATRCTFFFKLTDVRDNATSYTFAIGQRGTSTWSQADLKALLWQWAGKLGG